MTAATAGDRPVVAVYVLDDDTPGDWRMGGASRWWLQQSLRALAQALKAKGASLVLRRGRADRILPELMAETGAGALHFMRDYMPWSDTLEQRVQQAAQALGVECHRHRGALLFEPETIATGSGTPFKVYSPFARACLAAMPDRQPLPAPQALKPASCGIDGDRLEEWNLYQGKPDWASGFGERWTPGEQGAREKLDRLCTQRLSGYRRGRDRPDLFATSRLSPHLHFGEVSPLHCWRAVETAIARHGGRADGGGDKFLRELLWREFSSHLLHHFPQLPEQPLRAEFAGFPYREDAGHLKAWQRGTTGYPIVDAGMRELWLTGWMHNRVRMVAASFLIKDLLIDWRHGMRWFWDTLVDADLANNSASWQWVAGCGADAAPYFRIFNPVLQGKKFDPKGDYVRRWVPELKELSNEHIHEPWAADGASLASADVRLGETYPRPVVEHREARKRALAAYERIKG